MKKIILMFFTLLLSFLISAYSFAGDKKFDRYGFESGFSNYHLWKCNGRPKVNLRGIASADVNLKTKRRTSSPRTEIFGKEYEKFKQRKEYDEKKKRFHFFTQDKASGVDFDRDGKNDCKRVYYKKSKQIKKEICDFNHDGVVDSLEKYSRNGLKTFEGSNSDGDPFFEIKENCKFTSKKKNHAKCIRKVEYTGDKKYDHQREFYLADLRVKKPSKISKRKRSRSVASVNQTHEEIDVYRRGMGKVTKYWTEAEGPISDKILPIQKDFLRTLAGSTESEYGGYYWTFKTIAKRWNKPGTTRADKFFMSIRGWEPRMTSCLSEAPSYCKGANYKRMGLGKNQKTYEMCLTHTYHSCREEKTTEAALCFDCLGKEEGSKLNETVWQMLKPIVGRFEEECGELPPIPPLPEIPDAVYDLPDKEVNEYFENRRVKYLVPRNKWRDLEDKHDECKRNAVGEVPDEIAKDSPKGFYKSELFGFLVHENCFDELVENERLGGGHEIHKPKDVMKLFNEMVAQSFQCFDGGSNPQSWFQTRRLLRAFKPDLYSKFQGEIGIEIGKGGSPSNVIPENWVAEEKVICNRSNTSCEYLGPEYDGKVKFFCTKNSNSEVSSGGRKEHGALRLDARKDERHIVNGPTMTIGWDGFNWEDASGHMVSHAILGHTHGIPREQSDGTWVCGWNPEMDYAEACNEEIGRNRSKEYLGAGGCNIGCTSFPTSHLKPNGDYTDEYLELQSHEEKAGGAKSVAKSLKECQAH